MAYFLSPRGRSLLSVKVVIDHGNSSFLHQMSQEGHGLFVIKEFPITIPVLIRHFLRIPNPASAEFLAGDVKIIESGMLIIVALANRVYGRGQMKGD